MGYAEDACNSVIDGLEARGIELLIILRLALGFMLKKSRCCGHTIPLSAEAGVRGAIGITTPL